MIIAIMEIQIKTMVVTVCTYQDGYDFNKHINKQKWQRTRVDKTEEKW